MSTFMNTDPKAFSGVWVFCEQRQGKMMPTTFELISEGRKLADELGVNLCGLLLGDNVEGIAKELGGYGADEVIVCEHPLLKNYTTDAYAKVICDVIEDLKPEAFLIGATNIGRDLGPRCAARLHTGLCADCTHLDVDVPNYIQFLRESSTLDVDSMKWDMEDRNLKMTRPAFGGHLMATIICPRFRPCMATVRPGVMKKNAFDEAKANAVEIVKPSFTLTAEDIHTVDFYGTFLSHGASVKNVYKRRTASQKSPHLSTGVAGRVQTRPRPSVVASLRRSSHSPARISGRQRTWPMVSQPKARYPSWASGTRTNSTMKRNSP